jgi:hypothetical protein
MSKEITGFRHEHRWGNLTAEILAAYGLYVEQQSITAIPTAHLQLSQHHIETLSNRWIDFLAVD